MKKRYLATIVSLLGGSSIGVASEYPLEFADFFDQRNEQVEVVIEGLPRSEQLVASVSYDIFQLAAGEASVKALSDFLVQQRLSSQAITAIVRELEKGVKANPGCKQALISCIPEDLPERAEFVFDYDSKLLRIFVSSDMFESYSREKEYHDPMSAKRALVNWSNLYGYASHGAQNVAWTNETYMGLPSGYLSVNSQYQNADGESNFDVYRAIYNYEKDDIRLLAGYQDGNSVSLNSTDFLNNGGNYSGLSLALGRSTNLLKGNISALQRLHFFVPQDGQLEIYQGERLLISKVINAGEQSIGYDELPVGTYTVTLRFKQGSTVVLEEQRQVVNSTSFALPVGEWDYRFEVGRFDKDDRTDALGEPLLAVEHREYVRALASYRPMESWLVGSGLVSNGNNTQWLLGTRLAMTERSNFQYTAGLFSGGDVYQFGQLSLAPLSFTMRQLDHSDLNRPDGLVRTLYGTDNFKEYGVNLSSTLGEGRVNLSYYRSDIEGLRTQSSRDYVTLTWLRNLWGGDFTMTASLSQNERDQENYNIGVSWSRRVGSNAYGRIGTSYNSNDQIYTYADAGYTHNDKHWSATSRVGVQHYSDADTTTNGSVSLTGKNDAVRYDAYGYIDTNGSRSISGSLSGTQMLSLSGGALTSERGTAYVELAPTWGEAQQSDAEDTTVNYSVLLDGRVWHDKKVAVGQSTLVSLPVYSGIEFDLDTDSQNIDAQSSDSELFAMPGTYYQLDSAIIPLASQVFILNDINGDPVQFARCLGEGCKSVEPLSKDGVFRVNYRSEMPFKLVSNKRLCVYDPSLMGERYIQAYCLPGLEDADAQLVRKDAVPILAKNNGNEPLLYIGKYESGEEIVTILERLDEVGLISKSIEVGAVQYVYVQYRESYSVAQQKLLESLNAYVILDLINTKQLFTTRLGHDENS